MYFAELLKKLSGRTQGPLKAPVVSGWQWLLHLPLSHDLLPHLPRQVWTAQSGLEPGQGMMFGPVSGLAFAT